MRRQDKKAQAAMEFIMTYGWAILAVTVVIGALVYFGIFSPRNLLPETCSFPSELSCVGKALASSSDNTISVVLSNNAGSPITIVRSGIDSSEDCIFVSATVDGGDLNVTVANGDTVTIVVTCSSLTAGRINADITVPYLAANGLTYPVVGTIQANAG